MYSDRVAQVIVEYLQLLLQFLFALGKSCKQDIYFDQSAIREHAAKGNNYCHLE